MSRIGDLIRLGIDASLGDIHLFSKPIKLSGASETPGTTAVQTLIKDGSGDILLATGTTVPTDAEAGYAKGCLFIDTDVGAGTTGLYVNVGTTTSCNFDAVQDA